MGIELGFFKKKPKKPAPVTSKFDRSVLRRNDISLLILDERWNSLFVKEEKTPEIIEAEEKLKELLKRQAKLTNEAQEITVHKKASMDHIIQLTTEAYEKNNSAAQEAMTRAQKEITQINDRLASIPNELYEITDLIKEANIELLEHTVNVVYFKISENHRRVAELDKLIEDTRTQLQAYIDEKETRLQEGSDTYTYFHDLLGPDELQKLDEQFLKSNADEKKA